MSGKSAAKNLWLDYDKEVDVLYVSFRRPQKATDSRMEGDLVYYYRDGELVGVTVLHASEVSQQGRLIQSNNTSRWRMNRAEKRIVPPETLRQIVERIVAVAQPEKIILLGSAARGEMGPDSDVDLLVIKAGRVDLTLLGKPIATSME